MKAVVLRSGPPEVRIKDVEKPVTGMMRYWSRFLPPVSTGGIRACGIRYTGTGLASAKWRESSGFNRPKNNILGMELAGEMRLSVKKLCSRLAMKFFCMHGMVRFRGVCQSGCSREDGVLALKPTNMNFERAASYALRGNHNFGDRHGGSSTWTESPGLRGIRQPWNTCSRTRRRMVAR